MPPQSWPIFLTGRRMTSVVTNLDGDEVVSMVVGLTGAGPTSRLPLNVMQSRF
jgi:hypothetical protein